MDILYEGNGENSCSDGVSGHCLEFLSLRLAEDNPADVGLVRQALRDPEVHCELRVIPDGEAVVTFIDGLDLDGKLRCPNLLLLDLHLPKRDGTGWMP